MFILPKFGSIIILIISILVSLVSGYKAYSYNELRSGAIHNANQLYDGIQDTKDAFGKNYKEIFDDLIKQYGDPEESVKAYARIAKTQGLSALSFFVAALFFILSLVSSSIDLARQKLRQPWREKIVLTDLQIIGISVGVGMFIFAFVFTYYYKPSLNKLNKRSLEWYEIFRRESMPNNFNRLEPRKAIA